MGTCLVAHFLGANSAPRSAPKRGQGPSLAQSQTPTLGLQARPRGVGAKYVCVRIWGQKVARGTPGRPFICLCKRDVSADGNVFPLSAAFLKSLLSLKYLQKSLRKDCCTQIFHRYFTDISQILQRFAGVLSFYQ